jgi:ABC-2 type transport system ATP-binding protein
MTTHSFEHQASRRPRVGDSPSIEVRQLVREFRNGPRAVDGIDLAVWPGEIYGFLGPNGAGKSTTVLILTTLLAPTGGTATVGGLDVVGQARQVREKIGAALQEVALDDVLTGREHLRFQATLHGLSRRQGAIRAQELLQRVGLLDAAGRRIATYSGGMRRRLDLALALVHRPRILFLDEPTTGLDPSSRAALWTEVGSLARDDGVTVFLTTQYLEEADALADRVGIIDRGKIVAEGTPAELKTELGNPTVDLLPAYPGEIDAFLDTLDPFGPLSHGRDGHLTAQLPRGEAQLADFVRALDEAGLSFAALNLHRPSLDDVFLAKTGRTLEGASTTADPSTDKDTLSDG